MLKKIADLLLSRKGNFYATLVWFGLSFAAALSEVLRGRINNYYIYKYVFFHTIDRQNLYTPYPAQYGDVNHYGPLFSLVIAPFALLPDFLGVLVWTLLNCLLLYYAIQQLPFEPWKKTAILWLTAIELMTNTHSMEFNGAVTAMLILSFLFARDKKEMLSTLFIMIGFWIKIYGIVGLLFFFFAKRKLRFVIWSLIWLLVLGALPMLISSPKFILDTYVDWWQILIVKNSQNIFEPLGYQNVSAMGVLMYLVGLSKEYIGVVIAIGMIGCLLPYLRHRQWTSTEFQMISLSSLLLFIVMFSTGSESPTFILVATGLSIWYVTTKAHFPPWGSAMILIAILASSLSTTDFVPQFIKTEFVRPYRLKAVPALLCWCVIQYQLLTKRFVVSKERSL